MSNIRKCAHRECKNEINIKKDAYFTIQLTENRRKEYHCATCGMGIADHFFNNGGINLIKDGFRYISENKEEFSGTEILGALNLLSKYSIEEIEKMAKELGVSA